MGTLTHHFVSALGTLSLALVTAPVHAQSTWIVDAAGGPGSHYTDLPDAFGVVQNGDSVQVLPGNYTPGVLTKGIRLVFSDGAIVDQTGDHLLIRNTAPGTTCSVSGLKIGPHSTFFPGGGLDISDCQGVVVVDGANLPSNTAVGAMFIRDCASIVINDSFASPGIDILNSSVTISDSTFEGYFLGTGTSAIAIAESDVELNHCSARGGSAHGFAYDGVFAHNSSVVIRGDASDVFEQGVYIGLAGQALRGSGNATLTIDPDVTVTAAPTGWTSITTRHMPITRVIGTATTVDITAEGSAGAAYGILVGLPSLPLDTVFFGTLWLDGPSISALVSGVLDAGGQTTVSVARPADPGIIGLSLAFQALTNDGTIELANAAGLVLDSGGAF